ncbi:MAG: hypothetical protein IT165_01430 [Bryobacterales bacterium]|nr:hypothetical protein [Bryobacterales bacterium]
MTIIAIVGAGSIWGQNVPSVIPYQGKMTDQQGVSTDSAKPMVLVFRIYPTPIAGVPVWQEVHENVSLQDGYFSVLLGSRTSFPSVEMFQNVVYLGITIDDGKPETADIELRPRQAITPVIAAVHARSSDDAKRAKDAVHAERADLATKATLADRTPGEVPIGGIVPYSGDPVSLPENWKLCNNDLVNDPRSPFNGKRVPDLRAMFIRGVDASTALGASGGRDSYPDHSHWFGGTDNHVWIPLASINGYAPAYNPVTRAEAFDNNLRNLTAPDNAPAGAESHGHINGVASIGGYTVGAGGFDNRPRFVALHYIIRIW